jgi:16S rRNA (guanine(966)-N(2))-methyltransferase RsmD
VSLRLTGGEFRGRIIQTPKHQHTRPTQARLRQALFNSIQTLIPDARILDLFAGSGALGFEALSRGASQAVFVEDSKTTVRLIERNAQDLKVLDRSVIWADAVDREYRGGQSSFWKRILSHVESTGPFDIVLADPPYDGGWEMALLEHAPWKEILTENGVFCLEWGSLKSQVSELPERIGFLVKTREKNYGDSVLTTYQLET